MLLEDFYAEEGGHEAAAVEDRRSAIIMLAHDHKKAQLVDLAICYRDIIAGHRVVATATTGRLLSEMVGLPVETLSAGLDGDDREIAAFIAGSPVAAVIFLVDPFTRRPHEPRVESVLAACSLYDVPLATNLATAGAVLNLVTVLEAAGTITIPLLQEK